MNKEYEQMVLDMTLQFEKDIKENVNTAVEFIKNKLTAENDAQPGSVARNRHECYGVAAETFATARASVKRIQNDLDDLLGTLHDPNLPALEATSAICTSSFEAARNLLLMAAKMRIALSDLYTAENRTNSEPTPMDEWISSAGAEEFEEAEPADMAEEMED